MDADSKAEIVVLQSLRSVYIMVRILSLNWLDVKIVSDFVAKMVRRKIRFGFCR